MARDYDLKQVASWAMYDWANSAFATTVMAGFFPVFFREYWSQGVESTVSTFRLGAANSLASIIVVAFAPVLGAIGDCGGTRKKFLLFFAAMGVVMTGSLHLVAQGHWLVALLLYGLGVLGFSGGNIFYDSLIVNVAGERDIDLVSALGYSLGYLGGGLLFALNVAMTLAPRTFGLENDTEAMRISFLSVAIWWAVFSVPILLLVKEPKVERRAAGWGAVTAGLRQLRATFQQVRNLRVVFLFLIAYWLYIDGVDTFVRMAVDYGMSLGLRRNSLIVALLITQFVSFPAAIAFGKLGQKLGAKTGILIGMVVYVAVTVWGSLMRTEAEFYALAVAVGLVQGGVQSLSRSLYARIIPQNKAAQFFGFYNMLGKFAAVIGPVLMGWVGLATGNPRYSILAVALLFVAGGVILYFVDEEEGRRAAREL